MRERSGWNGQRWLSADEPLWVGDVGQGATSPIVVNNRVYTLGWADDKDRVVCLALDTGQEIWSESYPAPLHARHANGDEGAPKRHHELARLQFESSSDVWPHVVLANGRLICKDRTGHLVCLKTD